jgi:predicted nucleic acid-binding protein
VYADTSALAKLVWDEDGSALMRSTFSGAEGMVTTVVAYAELRAALGAAMRNNRLPSTNRDATLVILERLWGRLSEIVVDAPLSRNAGELAERFGLRGYDAMHLAALTYIGSPGEVTFACWDLQLLRAAQELGYVTIPS